MQQHPNLGLSESKTSRRESSWLDSTTSISSSVRVSRFFYPLSMPWGRGRGLNLYTDAKYNGDL